MIFIQITLSILFGLCCYVSYLIGYNKAMKYSNNQLKEN